MANPYRYDAIVIGSGVGGLTAASLLSRKGWKVLLLEKEKQLGGYVVTFKRGEWTFDATGAFVGGCQEGGALSQILREVEAEKEIEFIPVRHIDNFYPGFKVSLREGGFPSYTDALRDLFPGEDQGLKAYLTLIQKIGDEIRSYDRMNWIRQTLFPFYFPNLVRYYRSTHEAILDRFFKDPEIKMALHTLPATEPPSRLSFLFVAAVINKALQEGVSYPKGGMGQISQCLVKSFLRWGGEVRSRSAGSRILLKDGRVWGIETQGEERFEAPVLISDLNPRLLGQMLPQDHQQVFLKGKASLEPSQSCFILYLATDLNLKHRALPYFTFLRSFPDLEEEARMMQQGEIPENPTLILTIPTLLDPSLAPPGHHIVRVFVTAPHSYQREWGKDNPERYREVKNGFAQRVLEQVDSKLIPGLKDHILYSESASPVTLERYTGNEMGAMYGLASVPDQMGRGRPCSETFIPGLYQVGHYTRPSHGIVGTALSGLFAVRRIMKKWEK